MALSDRQVPRWRQLPRWCWLPRRWRFWQAERTSSLGASGEQLAADYLRARGYQILRRNYRNRYGEIDLISRHQQTLVFVEVRSRRDDRHGDPAETISIDKQRRLTRAALAFMKAHAAPNMSARFDVVVIVWGEENEPPLLRHLPHAFGDTD